MKTISMWGQMIARCYDPEHPKYRRYGGRGIRVCDRWICFRLFVEDMGKAPEGMTLNRIDNDGNYSPHNCEWASYTAQARNKSDNRLVTFKGQTKCVSQWAEETGIKRRTLQKRIESGWAPDIALTLPVSASNKHGRYAQ